MPFDLNYPLTGSVYGSLVLATVGRIQALSLDGINTERVVPRCVSWDLQLPTPYVICRPAPETINPDEGTNERDAVNYAVMISMVAANAAEGQTTLFGMPLYWRERVRQSMQNQSAGTWPIVLPENCSMNRSTVTDGEPFIEQAKRLGYDAQYMIVRFNVWEPRATA